MCDVSWFDYRNACEVIKSSTRFFSCNFRRVQSNVHLTWLSMMMVKWLLSDFLASAFYSTFWEATKTLIFRLGDRDQRVVIVSGEVAVEVAAVVAAISDWVSKHEELIFIDLKKNESLFGHPSFRGGRGGRGGFRGGRGGRGGYKREYWIFKKHSKTVKTSNNRVLYSPCLKLPNSPDIDIFSIVLF